MQHFMSDLIWFHVCPAECRGQGSRCEAAVAAARNPNILRGRSRLETGDLT